MGRGIGLGLIVGGALLLPFVYHLAEAEEVRVPAPIRSEVFPLSESRVKRCLAGCHTMKEVRSFGLPTDALHELALGLRY